MRTNEPINPAIAAELPLLLDRFIEIYSADRDGGGEPLGILQDDVAVEAWLRRRSPCRPVMAVDRIRGFVSRVRGVIRRPDDSIEWSTWDVVSITRAAYEPADRN